MIFRDLLREAVDYQWWAFENDEHVDGGDLVEWFAGWRLRVEEALKDGQD